MRNLLCVAVLLAKGSDKSDAFCRFFKVNLKKEL